MKLRYFLHCGIAGVLLAGAGLFAADVASTNETVTSPPVFVPDTSHENDPMPDGVLAWNSLMQETNAAADQELVRFTFTFTNIATGLDVSLVKRVTTNANSDILTSYTSISNSKPVSVTILSAHASCGCTQPELPPLPWTIQPGGIGQFDVTVNLQGRSGPQIKSVTVTTDKGRKDLILRINILPAVIPTLTDAERARGVEIAKADRQAVFKADCAVCHAKPAEGKYSKALYDAVCAVCHDVQNRAAMVPDLHNLKVPTNEDFWRTWIAHGKTGTLMPAFATAEGGPLNDTQIATVAAYLNMLIPPPVVLMTNAPPAN
jgi:mono/diheme cytochrome c family protein